jgi:hypothetical protein
MQTFLYLQKIGAAMLKNIHETAQAQKKSFSPLGE